ncbi:hypothetical protein Mal15_29940 [Stieleria maiorica]|uniref:Uncharacterized protein n=1 Tax=Stieleria maiorica TaxID=2795974 RepID=A0A5B9MFQ3_9BACT|nr:hypothetical protein [Stieleria maiorica]QEF98936.1 hypothetical protein Mal15_29940 [Stieleria maiorica]
MRIVSQSLLLFVFSWFGAGIVVADAPEPKPGVIVRVSESWIQQELGASINEEMDVDTMLLGTHVVGKANTVGRIDADLEPCRESASIRINFSGRVSSKTNGYNGPVIIHSRCWTDFDASVVLRFDLENGVRREPVQINGETSSRTEGISTHRRLLSRMTKRVAAKRVAERREQTLRISRRRTLDRLAEHFQRHVDQQLAALDGSISFNSMPGWLKSILGNEHPQFWSSDDTLYAVLGASAADLDGERSVVAELAEVPLNGHADILIHRAWLEDRLGPMGNLLVGVNSAGSLFSTTPSSPLSVLVSMTKMRLVSRSDSSSQQSPWITIPVDPTTLLQLSGQ